MRQYETIVVIGAELGESRIREETAKIQSFLESHGATQVKIDKWGSREVGYRMRKPVVGHYFCFAYETENHALQDDLTGILRITDGVVKFLSIKKSDKIRKFKGYVRKDGASSGDSDELSDADAEAGAY